MLGLFFYLWKRKPSKINDMKNNEISLYSLSISDMKTYLMATLFVAGNLLLPQLCHFVPQGGLIFLPIYFFTLVAAYKYGFVTGLVTAVMSPVLNSLLFGMPTTAILPFILVKSVLLAVAASYAARRFGRVSLLILLAVVLFYQVLGSAVEWIALGNFAQVAHNLMLGIPGMLLQVALGYLIIKKID